MKRSSSEDEISDFNQDAMVQFQEEVKKMKEFQVSRWNQMLKKYSFADRFEKYVASYTDTPLLQVLRHFIEIEVGSPLKYYFIKSHSSRIKGNGKYSYWSNLLDGELQILRNVISDKHILMYVDNIVPAFNHRCLIDKIENKYKSKLKSYIQMRNNKLKSEEECRSLIEREWKLLEANIPEEFICAYYVIFFG